MIHWFNIELWQNLWPNIMAPSAFTLLGVLWSHIKLRDLHERHHQELKEHITRMADHG